MVLRSSQPGNLLTRSDIRANIFDNKLLKGLRKVFGKKPREDAVIIIFFYLLLFFFRFLNRTNFRKNQQICLNPQLSKREEVRRKRLREEYFR